LIERMYFKNGDHDGKGHFILKGLLSTIFCMKYH